MIRTLFQHRNGGLLRKLAKLPTCDNTCFTTSESTIPKFRLSNVVMNPDAWTRHANPHLPQWCSATERSRTSCNRWDRRQGLREQRSSPMLRTSSAPTSSLLACSAVALSCRMQILLRISKHNSYCQLWKKISRGGQRPGLLPHSTLKLDDRFKILNKPPQLVRTKI